MSIKEIISFKFSPQGISCVVIVAESHISIHTYPEHQYANVDVFSCGENAIPVNAIALIIDELKCQRSEITKKKKQGGIIFENRGMVQ